MKIPIVLIVFLAILTSSCASDSESDVLEPINDNTSETVTYTNTIATIMQSSCATSGCHDATSKTAGVDLTSYEHVVQAFENRDALGEIERGEMPIGSPVLPEATIKLIKNWIENGYLQ